MSVLTKDGWKLAAIVEWVPEHPDVKEGCMSCNGSGRGFSWACGDSSCSDCGGLGFRFMIHPRGQQPEVDPELTKMLRAAYQEYLKQQP